MKIEIKFLSKKLYKKYKDQSFVDIFDVLKEDGFYEFCECCAAQYFPEIDAYLNDYALKKFDSIDISEYKANLKFIEIKKSLTKFKEASSFEQKKDAKASLNQAVNAFTAISGPGAPEKIVQTCRAAWMLYYAVSDSKNTVSQKLIYFQSLNKHYEQDLKGINEKNY